MFQVQKSELIQQREAGEKTAASPQPTETAGSPQEGRRRHSGRLVIYTAPGNTHATGREGEEHNNDHSAEGIAPKTTRQTAVEQKNSPQSISLLLRKKGVPRSEASGQRGRTQQARNSDENSAPPGLSPTRGFAKP